MTRSSATAAIAAILCAVCTGQAVAGGYRYQGLDPMETARIARMKQYLESSRNMAGLAAYQGPRPSSADLASCKHETYRGAGPGGAVTTMTSLC